MEYQNTFGDLEHACLVMERDYLVRFEAIYLSEEEFLVKCYHDKHHEKFFIKRENVTDVCYQMFYAEGLDDVYDVLEQWHNG